MRRLPLLLGLLALLLAGILLGPRPSVEEAWVEPELPSDLGAWLEAREADVPALRPGARREIVWHDPDRRTSTPLSLVYLHGFSADRHEIDPVMTDLGRRLGANVYFARLTGHGRDGEAMAEATAGAWLADAVEAVAVGARIGERVVMVGTSTGATLAAWAAARAESRDRVHALVLVSPNLQPADRSSRILLAPWGGTVARLVVGPERCFTPSNDLQAEHWTTCYPTSALTPMMALVEHVRTMDWELIDVPTLLLYHPDDAVVDADETLDAIAAIPDELRTLRIVDETDDPSRHVLAGDILSPGSTETVKDAVVEFLEAHGLTGG